MPQPISDLFEIEYGQSLSLNKLTQTTPNEGIAFVSRTARNNAPSARDVNSGETVVGAINRSKSIPV